MEEHMLSSVDSGEDEKYHRLESAVRDKIEGLEGPLFETSVTPESLWDAYINSIPESRRQHYNCHACRRFIQKYGGLVQIDERGVQTPALWSIEVPSFFLNAIEQLYIRVKEARVTGVFLSSEKTWGQPETGTWTHLSGNPRNIFKIKVKDCDQVMAEKREDFKMLSHGLSDFSLESVRQAVRVLEADALDRSEKTLGVATWLRDLHVKIESNPRQKHNLIWLAVALAPPGFCHVRSTMISTLLEDIVTGYDFNKIRSRWSAKMHPLKYQRPTAPPKEGTIDQAEKLVDQLGIRSSFQRRSARLEDVLAKLWTPRSISQPDKKPGGMFEHLRESKKEIKSIDLPLQTMTWDKFRRTILPDVLDISILVPFKGSFYGMATAVNTDAPPIIQWDGLEGLPRNPMNWYFYDGGSQASDWDLVANQWAKVTAVMDSPPHWQQPDKFKHQPYMVLFAIEGCVDSKMISGVSGMALFPEVLKTDLHGVRSVIEAYSRKGSLQEAAQGTANGLALQSTGGTEVTLRIRTSEGFARYKIDRLD